MSTMISNSKHCDKCGSNHKSRPFTVYADGTHCFSCGSHKSSKRDFIHGQIVESTKAINLDNVILNYNDFSLINKEWLLKYFIYESHCTKHGIAQHKDGALVFPHIVNNKIVMYQKRWLKYVDGAIVRDKIRNYGKRDPMYVSNFDNNKQIILVEDPISCYRVSEQYNVACLWGTSIKYWEVMWLTRQWGNIKIWLDGDVPGKSAAKTIADTCSKWQKKIAQNRSFGRAGKVDIINTPKDPKCYTNIEILKIVEGI